VTAFHALSLLLAHPELDDPNFRRSVVYLLEHDENGACGVVLNRPRMLDVAEHLELSCAVTPPSVFYEGGPVETNAVLALGSDGYSQPTLLDIEALKAGAVSAPPQMRFFVGYAGWSPGQLEAELAGESWFVLPLVRDPLGCDDVFGGDPEGLWRRVLRRQRGPLSSLALYPDDLMAN